MVYREVVKRQLLSATSFRAASTCSGTPYNSSLLCTENSVPILRLENALGQTPQDFFAAPSLSNVIGRSGNRHQVLSVRLLGCLYVF